MNGPSVVSTSPLATRTTVAVSGSCRRPEKTQAPADIISFSRVLTCFHDCCISWSVIGSLTSPSTLWTDNRYCAIVKPPCDGRAHSRLSSHTTNGPRPDRQVYPGIRRGRDGSKRARDRHGEGACSCPRTSGY